MDIKIIDDSLLFYGINDVEYKSECYKCIEFLNDNPKIRKEFNDLFNILFVDKTNKVKELWNIKSINMLFSELVHPLCYKSFITKWL